MLSANDLKALIDAEHTYGLASPETAASMPGLQFLQSMIDGDVPRPPAAKLVGIALTNVEPGFALFQFLAKADYYNPHGTVHGGVLTTLLDSAMGCAVQTTLAAGRGYTTLELKVNFVRPVTVETGPLRAEGRILNAGRRIATAEGKILDPQDRLFAHATTTCMLFDRPARTEN